MDVTLRSVGITRQPSTDARYHVITGLALSALAGFRTGLRGTAEGAYQS